MCESTRVVSTNVPRKRFMVPYEHVVIAVGEKTATFGVPGVREHCFFMKEVSDSVQLRKRISTQFEAAEYITDEEELRGALRFVVVGGGPTGVEFAGTMSDFLFNEVLRNYKRLLPFTEVRLVQSGGSILPVFDKVLQDRAAENLANLNVQVVTGVRVRPCHRYVVVTARLTSAWHHRMLLVEAVQACLPCQDCNPCNSLCTNLPEHCLWWTVLGW